MDMSFPDADLRHRNENFSSESSCVVSPVLCCCLLAIIKRAQNTNVTYFLSMGKNDEPGRSVHMTVWLKQRILVLICVLNCERTKCLRNAL